MKSVRLWYNKGGLAVYISHLDMNRCMIKAVRRADIPLWYTEGFNPHPYMTFLLPLPLGQAALREPIDIKIEGEMTLEEIKERMNSVMPGGLEIVDVTEPVNKSNEIAFAHYEITLEFADLAEAESFAGAASAAVASGEITAEKRSKKGMKTVNLCEMIASFEARAQDESVAVDAVLAAGSSVNLNADLLMNSLFSHFSIEPKGCRIVRKELLLADFKLFQ